jgi:hypothetical protein
MPVAKYRWVTFTVMQIVRTIREICMKFCHQFSFHVEATLKTRYGIMEQLI